MPATGHAASLPGAATASPGKDRVPDLSRWTGAPCHCRTESRSPRRPVTLLLASSARHAQSSAGTGCAPPGLAPVGPPIPVPRDGGTFRVSD